VQPAAEAVGLSAQPVLLAVELEDHPLVMWREPNSTLAPFELVELPMALSKNLG
jgi:hypothetical protein